MEVFDPVLSAAEITTTTDLGCRVVLEDERGRQVGRATDSVLHAGAVVRQCGGNDQLVESAGAGEQLMGYWRYMVEVPGLKVATTAARGFLEEIEMMGTNHDDDDRDMQMDFITTSWHSSEPIDKKENRRSLGRKIDRHKRRRSRFQRREEKGAQMLNWGAEATCLTKGKEQNHSILCEIKESAEGRQFLFAKSSSGKRYLVACDEIDYPILCESEEGSQTLYY